MTADLAGRTATGGTMTGQRGAMNAATPRHLSRALVVLTGTLFTAGVAAGWLSYLHRSAIRAQHAAGMAAWPQHAVVAAVASLALGLRWRHRRRAGRRVWLLAPLGSRAAARVAALARAARTRPGACCRAAAATPVGLLFLYGFFRSGFQVTSGLDPNATVNAWGGPTYAGAMACHYLDALVIMAAAAWLLDRVLPGTAAGAGHRPARR